jgi:hypothetical protein
VVVSDQRDSLRMVCDALDTFKVPLAADSAAVVRALSARGPKSGADSGSGQVSLARPSTSVPQRAEPGACTES